MAKTASTRRAQAPASAKSDHSVTSGSTQSGSTLPRIGEGKRGVSGHIGYLLRQAGNAYRTAMEHALAGFDLTLPQFAVLTMIDAYPGASSADLSRLALLTPATMSVIVANLDRDGLIVRVSHPVHGRIRRTTLSETGKRVLDDAKQLVAQIENQIMETLTPSETVTVKRWLVDIALRLDGYSM